MEARTSVIPTHNYFAPLRMFEVDSNSTAADGAGSEPRTQRQPTPMPKAVGRPLPSSLLLQSSY
jgi:hypothetical protein